MAVANGISKRIGQFNGLPTEQEVQSWKIERAEGILKRFSVWKEIHVAKKWERLDTRYTQFAHLKVQYAGMSDEGKLLIKVACDHIVEYDNTPESVESILQSHDEYMNCVCTLNRLISEKLVVLS